MTTNVDAGFEVGALSPPPVVRNERARYMISDVTPAFTDLVSSIVDEEASLHRRVSIELQDDQDLDIQSFCVGLSRIFGKKEFIYEGYGKLRRCISRAKEESTKNLEETFVGNFVKFGVDDSLTFATLITGAVTKRIHANLQEADPKLNESAVLRSKDFHGFMNDIARAGFGFYTTRLVIDPDLIADGLAAALQSMEPGNSRFEEIIDLNEAGRFKLKPEYKQAAIESMKAQNKLGKVSLNTALGASNQQVTTVGCPVAHVIKGLPKDTDTGIAVWCNFLADQYEKYTANQSKSRIGKLATRLKFGQSIKLRGYNSSL